MRFSGATDGIIQNSSIGTTFSAGKAISITAGANRNRAINNTVMAGGSANGIYIDGGSNVSVDCQGSAITGANASATYGIYSDQINTTVQNCQVSNFSTGIYFNGADNGTINNTSSSTTRAPSGSGGYAIYLYNGASYNQIINSNGTATNGYGIVLSTGSIYNSITGCIGSTGASAGIQIDTGSNNTRIEGSTGAAADGYGMLITMSANSTILNSNATTAGNGSGIWINASQNSQLSNIIGTLLSANAAQQVARAQRGAHALCEGDKHTVTSTVAMRVVDLLE